MSKRPLSSSAGASSPKAKRVTNREMEHLVDSTLKKSPLKFSTDLSLGKTPWDAVFICGPKVAIESLVFSGKVPPELKSTLEYWLKKQAPDKPLSALLPLSNGDSATVRVMPTPEDASRHNAPGRPDVYAKNIGAAKEFEKESGNIKIFSLSKHSEEVLAAALACARGSDRFSFKTNDGKDFKKFNVYIEIALYSQHGSISDDILKKCTVLSKNIRMAQALVTTPPNVLNTTTYTDFCQLLADSLGNNVSMKTITGDSIKKQGFGGLHCVGKGCSTNPPAMVILSWAAKNTTGASRVLVGKGITYDSGGLGIKPASAMYGMKIDMGGSAGLLGAFASFVELHGHNENHSPVHMVLCLAENSIGPDSYRNDDVVTLYSGLTVEINHTDAEGRLVVSDGVAYAVKHLNPALVCDMATLTGAGGYATGMLHGALLSNCERMENTVFNCGRKSGECVYPLLFCPELHKAQFESKAADMTNNVLKGTDAQVSCAGWFIYENMRAACPVKDDVPTWVHVDMAYPVTTAEKCSTGYGVALVSEVLEHYVSHQIEKPKP